jgi:hypothetical protein
LGGLYAHPSGLWFLQLLAVIAFIAATIAAFRKPGRLAYGFTIVGFGSLVLLTLMPWDETFISLKHVRNLIEVGRFSFSRQEMVEGSAELLPFFFLPALERMGLPLLEGALLISGLGGLLCLTAGRQWLAQLALKGTALDLATLAVAVFPPLIWNTGSGFAATLFTATLLWTIVAYARHEKRATLLLLSLIPTIRIEGVFFVALVIAYDRMTERHLGKSVLLAFAPLALLTGLRKVIYGYWLPLPVLFKASGLTRFYLGVGAGNAYLDFFYGLGAISIVLLILSGDQIRAAFRREGPRRILGSVVLLGIFVGPYYLGGGDWLRHWYGRYLLPFSFSLFLFAVAMFAHTLQTVPIHLRATALLVVALTYFVPSPFGLKAFGPLIENSGRAESLARVDYLSRFGQLLGQTLPPEARIASSEIATLMFFANRDAVDLLGVANPNVIAQPAISRRDQFGAILPYLSYPGFLMLRRHDPRALETAQPEVVYPLRWEAPSGSVLNDEALVSVLNHEPDAERDAMNEFRYGGNRRLLELRYHPVAIVSSNEEFFLYWVSAAAWSEHAARLKQLGFTERQVNWPSPSVSSRDDAASLPDPSE